MTDGLAPASGEPLVECRICGALCRSVGHHVARKHGLSAAAYRAAHGILPGEPLTSPSAREAMAAAARRTIASGALDAHYAGNAGRAQAAGQRGADVLRALRGAGAHIPTGQASTPTAVIEAIVVAIEAGQRVATAVKASPICMSTFHAHLARHPGLKARVARARLRGAPKPRT